jgi:hypothetical protein
VLPTLVTLRRLLCLSLLVLTAGLAAAPAADARALQVGIASDGLLLNGSRKDAEKAVKRWAELGIDTVRLQVQWSRVAPSPRSYTPPEGFDPANPDAGYLWADVDRAVNILVAHGLRPILLLGGPPPLWASSRPRVGNPRYLPNAWHFGQFAAAVAKRYGDVTEEYILWNEPNLPLWLQPQATCKGKRCTPVSPHTYRYMVRAAYPLIHANDATSKVLVGALAPAGANLRSKNANMRPLQWMRAFGCLNDKLQPIFTGPCRNFEPAPMDGFAYHPHSTKHPPDEPYPRPDDAGLASLRKVQDTLDALQNAGRVQGSEKPLGLWLDEYAYQTNPPDKERGVTPGRQDRYLQQAAYLAWANPRVQLIAQYLWEDEPPGGGKRYTGWQSGLLDHHGEEKPALAHFDDPLWVDYKRNVIWGQIRPGTEHDVEIQMRPAGSGTAWQPLARIRTVADGSFFIRTPLQPFASYRAVWDGGARTTATHVASPFEDGVDASTGPAERTKDGVVVERREVADVTGAPVPRSFAGFSMEWTSIPDYLGTGGQLNPIFERLVGWLAQPGNGSPTLRFGGESTDHTWWNPAGLPKPEGKHLVTDINAPWLQHLNAWVQATRTPLMPGLNMGMNEPARAAEMAAAFRANIAPQFLRAFELGNEPDLYPTARAYSVGTNVRVRQRKRPVGYGYPEYRQEINDHVAAIHPAAPDINLSAGGFASGAWDDLQDDILQVQRSVRSWSAHAYPLQTCDRDIRRRGGERYIHRLLAPNAYASIVDRMRHLVAVAASEGATVQVSEMNSAICGGLRGLSDTMAAALWGTDILFGLAEAGVRGVNFHQWTGSLYGPVEMKRAHGQTVAHVRPLFYAMLLFNRAAPPGAKLVPVGPNPASDVLKTWGTVDRVGTRRFVVINKNVKAARQLRLKLPKDMAKTATVERLSAPTAKSQNNVTFGGRGWGGSTSDGKIKGKRVIERPDTSSGTLTLHMPRGSAALVTVKSSRPPATAARR